MTRRDPGRPQASTGKLSCSCVAVFAVSRSSKLKVTCTAGVTVQVEVTVAAHSHDAGHVASSTPCAALALTTARRWPAPSTFHRWFAVCKNDDLEYGMKLVQGRASV